MPRVPTVRLDRQKARSRATASGMTQTEIAARAGVSSSNVNKGLCGYRIGKLVARSIARALKTPVDGLLAEDAEAIAS